MSQCPHCRQSMRASNLAQHMVVCPKNPPIHARLAQALRSDVDPTRIIPAHDWMMRSGKLGLPSAGVLKRVFGSWSGVAEHFGLHCDGYTQGPNSSFKDNGQPKNDWSNFDEMYAQIEERIQRTREQEQARISSSLNCREAYRGVGVWNVETHSWEFAYATSVWLVR